MSDKILMIALIATVSFQCNAQIVLDGDYEVVSPDIRSEPGKYGYFRDDIETGIIIKINQLRGIPNALSRIDVYPEQRDVRYWALCQTESRFNRTTGGDYFEIVSLAKADEALSFLNDRKVSERLTNKNYEFCAVAVFEFYLPNATPVYSVVLRLYKGADRKQTEPRYRYEYDKLTEYDYKRLEDKYEIPISQIVKK